MKWKKWLKGLISAAIGGAANSVVVIIVDPMTFNLQEGAVKLGWVALAGVIIAVAMFLQQSPIPENKNLEGV